MISKIFANICIQYERHCFIFCRMFTGDHVKIESYVKAIDNYLECGNYDRAHEKLSDAIKLTRMNEITNATIDLQLKVA